MGNSDYCDFSIDLRNSKDKDFLKRLEKIVLYEFEKRGYKAKGIEYVEKTDKITGILQIAGVDMIVSDSRNFLIEFKKQTYCEKIEPVCWIEILHDFYYQTKVMGWTWNLAGNILVICKTEGNTIRTHFFLDAQKVRRWFISLLEFNGFNDIYNQKNFELLMPNQMLTAESGRTFFIKPNKPTLLNGKIRNQSNYIAVNPYYDLRDCFFTDFLNRGQTKLNDYFENEQPKNRQQKI